MVSRNNSEDRSRNGHVLVWEQAELKPEYERSASKFHSNFPMYKKQNVFV